MVTIGGMYNVFEFIIEIYNKDLGISFTAKDLYDKIDLSDEAISNNLRRLVDIGLLTKKTTKDNNGNKTIYSFNTEVAHDFITNCLHK